MNSLSDREKRLIRNRRDALRKELYQLKTSDMSDGAVAKRRSEIDLVLSTLKKWLEGTPPVVKIDASMSKAEFDAAVGEILGDKSNGPGKIIEITSRKQLDDCWSWIRHVDVTIKASHAIKAYWKEKLDKERVNEL